MQGLVRPRVMPGGTPAYSRADIRHLSRIRRLRDTLGLSLPAVEVVLHLRQRVVELLQEMDDMERQMQRREQRLQSEIRELRRQLAIESRWRER
jgi:DNA-binding transcriptional MerR regulator